MKYHCYNCGKNPCILEVKEENAKPFMCPWTKGENFADWTTGKQLGEEAREGEIVIHCGKEYVIIKKHESEEAYWIADRNTPGGDWIPVYTESLICLGGGNTESEP